MERFFLDHLIYTALVGKVKLPDNFSRRINLIKDFENLIGRVSNGKSKTSFLVSNQMLGFYTGDFVLTRKFRIALKKKNR